MLRESSSTMTALEFQRHGRGQEVSCAIHEAVSKCTEVDLMSWVMRHAPIYRQTCRHARDRPAGSTGLEEIPAAGCGRGEWGSIPSVRPRSVPRTPVPRQHTQEIREQRRCPGGHDAID